MSLDLKRDYFNALAPRWDQLPSPPEASEKLARFVSLCVPPAAERVLDVGCGTGLLLEYLTKTEARTRHIVELDLAEQMLAENRKKAGDHWTAYVCADARRPPFRPGTFDVVLCFNVLPHITPIESALMDLVDCLRPNGLIAVGHLMGSQVLNAFHASLGGAVADDHLPSAPQLAGTLESMGAQIVLQEEAPGWYLVQARKRS